MPANHSEIEKKLWASADELRANSHLKSSEYSVPVLGLIFLRFADQRFGQVERELTATVHVGSSRTILQFSIEEAVEADKTFNMLMGDEVAPRKRFIESHAKNANLDV